MVKRTWLMVIAVVAVLVTGCAGLRSDYETPAVNVISFRALPTEGIVPRFEIGLNVLNPNRTELNLQGISYSVNLEGHRIVTGVASNLPVIEPYSVGTVTLHAMVDLLSSITLITDLMKQQREHFTYDFNAKLDLGGFRPNIHVGKKGEISLMGKDEGNEN